MIKSKTKVISILALIMCMTFIAFIGVNAVNIARSVRGSLVSCAVKEKDTQPGSFRVSMRSGTSGIDVSALCAMFGGGGHVCAAGCSIDAETIDRAIEMIVEKVAEVL